MTANASPSATKVV